MLKLNSSAAALCVINLFFAFFNVTSRSLSAWVISSCPSCIPKAWGCQDDISTLPKHDILTLLPQLRRVITAGRYNPGGVGRVFGTQVRRICLALFALAWCAIVPLGAASLTRPYTV